MKTSRTPFYLLTFYLLMTCFWFTHSLIAQTPNNEALFEQVLQPSFFAKGQKVFPFSDNLWIVSGQAGSEIGFFGETPFIAVLTSDGTILWRHYLTELGAEVGYISAIVPTSSHTFAALVYGGKCDVIGFSTVFHFDINGILLSGNSVWDFIGTDLLDSTKDAIILPNDDIIAVEIYGGRVQRSTLNNDIVWQNNYQSSHGVKEVLDMFIHPNQDILLAGEKGLFEINEDGDVLNQRYTNRTFEAIVASFAEQYAILSDNHLLDLNISLDIVTETDLSEWGEFSSLKVANGHYFLMGKNTLNDHSVFLELNEDFSYLHHFSYYHPSVQFSDFAVNHELILATGVQEFRGGLSRALAVKSFSLDGEHFVHDTDIGITDIDATEPDAFELDFGGCEQNISVRHDNVVVTIQNYGSSTINSLNINARYASCSFICFSLQPFLYTFDNIELLPGETMDFDLGTFYVQVDSSDVYNLCFWTSVPNADIDQDPENDTGCRNFIINDVTDIIPDDELYVFPNPVSDVLNIETTIHTDYRVSLYNVTGQKMMEASNTPRIDMTSFTAGMYWLLFEDVANQRRVMKRLVVTR